MPNPRFERALGKAKDAFWKKFAEQYPEVTTGDIPPGCAGGIRLRVRPRGVGMALREQGGFLILHD